MDKTANDVVTDGLQILLMEDDPNSRKLAEMCIQRALPACQITALDSVEAAKSLSAQEPTPGFDLLFLDGMLADGTVSDAWPALADMQRPGAPVFIVSAIDSDELSRVAHGVPAPLFMQKPINPAAVNEALRSSLGLAT